MKVYPVREYYDHDDHKITKIFRNKSNAQKYCDEMNKINNCSLYYEVEEYELD